jgi:hypothetical protein
VERLSDPAKQRADLRAKLMPEIDAAIARGNEAKDLARVAYLAICLDEAPALKQKYPERWSKAVQALAGYPKVVHGIFYNAAGSFNPIPAKAVAAGLAKPPK